MPDIKSVVGSINQISKIICMWLLFQCALLHWFNTLRPRQDGRHFPDNIFKCIFLNENVSISIMISLKFVPKDLIHIIPGDKPLSEPIMVSLLIHICITQPQWVNSLCQSDVIWDHATWSALVKLMTYCLTALSPLPEPMLIINGVLWHTSEGNFTGNAEDIYPWYEYENDQFTSTLEPPRGQWIDTQHIYSWTDVVYHKATRSYCIMWSDKKA